MRKRINYETSNNAITTLDPIEIFIYVIMIVCGRLRSPDNNFLLIYTAGSSLARVCGENREFRFRTVHHDAYAYTREIACRGMPFLFVTFGKKRLFRAPLSCLSDISFSRVELNGGVTS